MAKRSHEQHQTHAVCEEAEPHRQCHCGHGRPRGMQPRGERQIRSACDESFHGSEPRGVEQCDFSRHVVVDCPGEARPQNEQPRDEARSDGARLPRQDHGSGNDSRHTERDTPIHVLAKDNPREKRREDALGIEQQRRIRSRELRQAVHQEHRREHSAKQHRDEQVTQIRRSKLHSLMRPEEPE